MSNIDLLIISAMIYCGFETVVMIFKEEFGKKK